MVYEYLWDIELLEIKSSDSHYMSSAIEEYNKNGNFLSSKYFFKYYVQAQMQLACTGLEYCNLFFLIDAAPVNCKIKRNDSLISKVLNFVLKCEREVFNIRTEIVKNNQVKLLISKNIDNDTFNKLVEEIEELVVKSDFYQSGVEFDWINEFVEYVECLDLEIKTEQSAAKLEHNLIEINNLKVELNKIQNENKKREKPIKDLLKIKIDKIMDKYPLSNCFIKNPCMILNYYGIRTSVRYESFGYFAAENEFEISEVKIAGVNGSHFLATKEKEILYDSLDLKLNGKIFKVTSKRIFKLK